MIDIISSIAYQCNENDCSAPGTWHKGTYWVDETADTGYTYDEFSDGDHEEIEESDLPTPEQEVAAWAEYRQWALDNQADPLYEFMDGVPAPDSEQAVIIRREFNTTEEYIVNKPLCAGGRTPTDRLDAQVTCPVCHRVKRTLANGRIQPHFTPSGCEATVYHNRWPDKCSRHAVAGSRFCRQHGNTRSAS